MRCCAARLWIFGTSLNHELHGCSSVLESTTCEHDEASLRWPHSCDTFSSGSNSGENKGLRHVIPGTEFRVEHTETQTQMICRFCQEARSTEHVNHILSGHACVSHRTCSRLINNASARYSERARERVVDGCQTTAIVVSNGNECSPLTSRSNFLQCF